MTKAATAPKEPLALVPVQPVSHALAGTIEEKLRAFDQIAANMAQLAINGWDNAQKCKAACWLADGKGEHPAVFIENHYVMLIKGRLTIEPKWEYMVRKMKETVPGFRYKVLIETDDACKIEATDGIDTHIVEYTLSDAKRQGLLSRDGGNMWTTGSTREGCFKQAMKRALRRLGVGRSMPWVEMDLPDPTEAEVEPGRAAARAVEQSVAEVIEDEVPYPAAEAAVDSEGAAPSIPVATPPDSAPPPESKESSPVTKLGVALRKMYGSQKPDIILQKASMLYNEAMKASTGVEHAWIFKTSKDIGPVQAQQILAYLAKREAAGAREATGGKVAAPAAPLPTETLPLGEEVPPPAESEEPPAPERAPDLDRDLEDIYTDFMGTVKRAKALFGRKFVTEAPVGSGKTWFIDETTFKQAGKTASIKLSDNGEVTVSQQDLSQLNRILADDCDKQERSGR